MNPSQYLNEYLRRTTPAQAVIKKKAHAATLATCALIVPSLVAVYFRHAGIKENEPYWVWASLTTWKIHAAVIGVTILLWIFEKPRLTNYLPVEALGKRNQGEATANHGILSEFASSHPKLALFLYALLAILFACLTWSQFELAHNAWRWGHIGRAIGHVMGAAPLLLLTTATAIGPIAFVIIWFRRRFHSAPKI